MLIWTVWTEEAFGTKDFQPALWEDCSEAEIDKQHSDVVVVIVQAREDRVEGRGGSIGWVPQGGGCLDTDDGRWWTQVGTASCESDMLK